MDNKEFLRRFKKTICPYCEEERCMNFTKYGESTTLVGFFGGIENNPNHYSQRVQCKSCEKTFVKEWVYSKNSVWYTECGTNVILSGFPSCCTDSYLLLCECGGKKIHSTNSKESGGIKTFVTSGDRTLPKQPMYWQCNNCNKKFPDFVYGEEFMESGFTGEVEPEPPKKLKLNWTVKESVGIGVINKKLLV